MIKGIVNPDTIVVTNIIGAKTLRASDDISLILGLKTALYKKAIEIIVTIGTIESLKTTR